MATHGTLRRLRSQLAEDGCVESQLVIAQKLLDEGKGDRHREEEAISWLVKAAREDSNSARHLLKDCFQRAKGVTVKNYDDVVQCLSTDDIEHVLRSSARKLYSELSANGLVTSKLLMDSIRNKKCEKSSGESSCNSQENVQMLCQEGIVYKEEDLLDLASKIATGKEVHQAIDWEEQYQRVEYFTWREILCNPWCYYKTHLSQSLNQLVTEGSGILGRILYPSSFHLFLLLFLQWTTYIEEVTSFILPISIFYFTFLALIISTLQMLHLQKVLASLKCWMKILTVPSCDAVACESLYLWNNTSVYYLRFFLSIALLLFVYPLVNEVVPLGECAILSAIFSVVTFVAIGMKNDWLVTLSVFLHIFLMALPWALMNLPSWHYIGAWMLSISTIDVGPFLQLHLGFPALLFTITPLLFMVSIFRQHTFGIYRVLIPHLVTVFWLQLTVIFALDSNFWSLIRGLVLVPSVIMLFPFLYYLFLTVITVALILSFLFYLDFLLFCLVVQLSAIFQLFCQNERLMCMIRWSSLVAMIVTICPPLIAHYTSYELFSYYHSVPSVNLSWSKYYHACHHPAWSTESSLARVQYQCRILYGMPVYWEGSVVRVSIKQTSNKLERNVSFLPKPIDNWFRCLLGDQCPHHNLHHHQRHSRHRSHPHHHHHNLSEVLCKLREGECHLANWDVHTYEIVFGVTHHTDTAHVFAEASNEFTNFLLQIHRGDAVVFSGNLIGDVGGTRPLIKISTIECATCIHPLEPVAAKYANLTASFKSVFHFFLAPLFEFRI